MIYVIARRGLPNLGAYTSLKQARAHFDLVVQDRLEHGSHLWWRHSFDRQDREDQVEAALVGNRGGWKGEDEEIILERWGPVAPAHPRKRAGRARVLARLRTSK